MDILDWLSSAPEPWTRTRTLIDLLHRPQDDPDVREARTALLTHPQVQRLMNAAATWGQNPFGRHNDARYPIYALSTLADFGLRWDDPGMEAILERVMAHQSSEGPFQTLVNIPKSFGGSGQDMWTWMLCDAPTLLYVLLAMGLGHDVRVQQAVMHLVNAVDDNGWRCVVAPELGKFRGPGRKTDPCPIANVYALKALSLVPEHRYGSAAHAGTAMLLGHWERQKERKIYRFGIGTDFRKLKYPFIWYNILHVVDVLSRFPWVHDDPRFAQMVEAITCQADADRRYSAGSMYRAWEGWDFSNKKQPSSWITFLVLRILQRRETDCDGAEVGSGTNPSGR